MRLTVESTLFFERTPETQELFESPELAFDSDLESADEEYKRLMDRLKGIGETCRVGTNVTFETIETIKGGPVTIQITWQGKSFSRVLRLTPYMEGKGSEAGVFAYRGEYGTVRQNGETSLVPLSRLYGIPDGQDIVVKPTATRWTIGKDKKITTIFGENTWILYMGLGFLLLGKEYMHIGNHESWHIPRDGSDDPTDENTAWKEADKYYAALHEGYRDEILSGRSKGLFGLLKRPDPYGYGRSPTIGDIVKWGLVSHSLAGNAKVPKHWERKSIEIMDEFRRIICDADREYEYFIGR